MSEIYILHTSITRVAIKNFQTCAIYAKRCIYNFWLQFSSDVEEESFVSNRYMINYLLHEVLFYIGTGIKHICPELKRIINKYDALLVISLMDSKRKINYIIKSPAMQFQNV